MSTQAGEKSPVRGFHALMLAGAPEPVSSGLADCGPMAAGAIPGLTAARNAFGSAIATEVPSVAKVSRVRRFVMQPHLRENFER